MKLVRKRNQTVQGLVGHGQDLGVCPQGPKVMTYKGVSVASSVSSPCPNCTYILSNKATCPGSLSSSTSQILQFQTQAGERGATEKQWGRCAVGAVHSDFICW